MNLIPHHQGDKHGHREGTWKVVRTRRPGGNRNERPRWEVHERPRTAPPGIATPPSSADETRWSSWTRRP